MPMRWPTPHPWSYTATSMSSRPESLPGVQAAEVPPRRLLIRTAWLALPVTITLLILTVLSDLTPWAALLAWLLGLILSGVLAWRRERRLEATGSYLTALAEGREPPPLPEFGPLR